jgi:hypothetical protein
VLAIGAVMAERAPGAATTSGTAAQTGSRRPEGMLAGPVLPSAYSAANVIRAVAQLIGTGNMVAYYGDG